ncbi:MAG: hypothetical protein GY842_07490 [bacterium]|nr:hypothetical protein [bacterium]
MERVETSLRVRGCFDLRATSLGAGWHECSPLSWCEAGGCLQLIERFDEQVCRLGVTQSARRRTGTSLRVLIEAPRLNDELVTEMRRRVKIVIRAEEDLSEFHELCRGDSALRVIPRLGAGRTLRAASMSENIVKMLCSTNVTWTQAVKMINRIGQLGPYPPDFRNLNAWPTVREILRAGRGYLVEVARVGYRADAILEFCTRVRGGEFDDGALDALARNESSDALLKHLRSIRGIGPASAHYLLGIMGHHDRLSIDSSTVAHVARTHTRGRRPTHQQIENIYKRFGRWKQLAWWFEHWLTWDSAGALVAGLAGTRAAD